MTVINPGWMRFFLLLLLAAPFAPAARSEIYLSLPPEIESALPDEVRQDVGESVTTTGAWRAFSRDRRQLDPAYPWVLETEEWIGFLDEKSARAASELLGKLSAGDVLKVSGRWGALVDTEEPPWPGWIEAGDQCVLPVLVVESVELRPAGSFSPGVTPRPDLPAISRAIQAQELKAIRDPQYAPSARKKIVQLYLQSGQYQKAINEYRFEMILTPAQASYFHRKIGDVYRLMGDEENARMEMELSRLTQKGSSESLYRQRLTKWIKEGKYELAIQEYKYLLQSDRRSRPEYLEKIAQLYSLMGDKERARHYYERLIQDMQETERQTVAQRLDKALRLARIYEDMGDAAAARAQYEDALALVPEKKADVQLKTAQFLERRKDYTGALALYRRLEGMKGVDQSDLAERTARLLERNKDPGGAIREYERAAKLSPPPAAARLRLREAQLLVTAGRTEEALEAYRGALRELKAPARVDILEEMGDLLAKLDRKKEAVEAFREATGLIRGSLGQGGGSEEALLRLAGLEEKAGDPAAARRYYGELVSLLHDRIRKDPAAASRPRRRLIDLLEQLEMWDEVAAQYREWIKAEPNNSAPYYRLYRVYRDRLQDEQQAKVWEAKYRALKKK